ncbi:uncharacterized protein LOC122440883 [Cervus canadensis]|uniref:uncharacterized protein LOC122440883 n=1 Tax=Cervus canadensis TaxID=1574408 RepID=UPI001C9E3033|nr:uncharacterized protein LOC122440883 [Cervus canadensis]
MPRHLTGRSQLVRLLGRVEPLPYRLGPGVLFMSQATSLATQGASVVGILLGPPKMFQKPVTEKPSTTLSELENSGLLHRPSRGSHRGAAGGSQGCGGVAVGTWSASEPEPGWVRTLRGPEGAERSPAGHPGGDGPALAQLQADPPGTGALGRRVRLATRWPRRSGRARHPRPPPPPLLRLLLLLSGPVLKGAAESPWGLPFLADDPVSMAKVVMADLAQQKVENKSWPRGTHFLRYHYLYLSEPGPSLPKFVAVGYVDDQPFIQYDSRMDKAEPQAPWISSKNATYWEDETKKQRKWAEIHQVETRIEMGYHNHSTGIHSTQRMFGCEIQEDGHSNSF